MLSRCEAPKVMACTLYTSWAGSANHLQPLLAGTAVDGLGEFFEGDRGSTGEAMKKPSSFRVH